MDLVRWGIIGCGDVTEIKSGPAFYKADRSKLVAVMRRNGKLAEDYARRHSVPRWYDDADALIRDPEVDVVYVATPPGAHLEMALRVCAARKPAYIEKPMARNHVECQSMVDAFSKANLPLFVAYYRRRLPRFVEAKHLIDTGRLGKIVAVNYRQSYSGHRNLDHANLPWRLNAVDAGAGFFLDVGSHTLDILDYLVGAFTDVRGQAANLGSPYAVEDAVTMTFRTPTGAMGVAAWNFASPVHEDVIEITGSEARLSMSTFGNDPVRLQTQDGEEKFKRPNPPHVHQPLVQTIVDELLGNGKCPSSGASAARTSKVMDIVLNDYYHGRGDDFWNRPETWTAAGSSK